MDDEVALTQSQLQRLSPADQRDLQQFIGNEQQKAQVQGTIHELAEMCFKKCVTGSISSGRLTSKEDSCMSNCVDRFMDSNLAILQRLEAMRGQ